MLDAADAKGAAAACAAVGETLLPKATIKAYNADILASLSYHAYVGRAKPIQLYHINGGALFVAEGQCELTFPSPQTPFVFQSSARSRAISTSRGTATQQRRIKSKSSRGVTPSSATATRSLSASSASRTPTRQWASVFANMSYSRLGRNIYKDRTPIVRSIS